jgi:hypothetical protein
MSTAQSFQLSGHFFDNRREVGATFDGLGWIVTSIGPAGAGPIAACSAPDRQRHLNLLDSARCGPCTAASYKHLCSPL